MDLGSRHASKLIRFHEAAMLSTITDAIATPPQSRLHAWFPMMHTVLLFCYTPPTHPNLEERRVGGSEKCSCLLLTRSLLGSRVSVGGVCQTDLILLPLRDRIAG